MQTMSAARLLVTYILHVYIIYASDLVLKESFQHKLRPMIKTMQLEV